MAKIKCVHCGKTIDDKCRVCIYCHRKVGTLPDEVVQQRIEKHMFYGFIIIGVILVISLFVIIGKNVHKNIQNKEEINKLISEICPNSKYTKKSIEEIIQDNDCASFVYYVKTNTLDDTTIDKIINSKNEDIYSFYKRIANKELYEAYIQPSYNLDQAYLKYLLKNNLRLNYEFADKALLASLFRLDEASFTLLAQLVDFPSNYRAQIRSFLDYGYINDEDKIEDYEKRFLDLQNYAKYALIYHQNIEPNSCFNADLTTQENLEYLIKENNGSICEYPLFSNIRYLSEADLKRYKDLGGTFQKYAGSYYVHLLQYASYEELETKIPLYISLGMDINTKFDYLPGDNSTALDMVIYNGHSDCASYKNGWGDVDSRYTTNCKKAMQKYKLLKKYGAKCNEECSNEKWLK